MAISNSKSQKLKLVRRIHKWLMWIIGLQFLFWTLGGLYFSLFDIHFIHGESLVTSPDRIDLQKVNYGFAEVLKDYPTASNIKLYALKGQPFVQFLVQEAGTEGNPGKPKKIVIDAFNGNRVPPVNKSEAYKLAQKAYAGSGFISNSQLVTEAPPFELWEGHLPVWKMDFRAFGAPTLYISQTTGEVVTKRHTWWRIFDVFWRLHILDIFEGDNVKNIWLTIAATMAIITTLAGVILTWYLVIAPWLKYSRRKNSKVKSSFFRRWHRRLSVVVAVQMMIWISTGFYFNLMDSQWYSTGHFQTQSANAKCQPSALNYAQLDLPEAPVYMELQESALGCHILVHYKRVFRQYQAMQAQSLDVSSGKQLNEFSKVAALNLAQASYTGPGTVTNISLLESGESSYKKQQNPVWQVEFSDEVNTRVFVHSVTREVIRHENDNSRFHQLMFTLHFMDYFGTGGFSHWLLKLFALMALMLTLTGGYWLVAPGRSKILI